MERRDEELQAIWQATGGGIEIFMRRWPQMHKTKKFKMRDTEKTASANLHHASDGVWLLTDFGDDRQPRNAITALMHYDKLNYGQAIKEVLAMFPGIRLPGAEPAKPKFAKRAAKPEEEEKQWSFEVREFTEADLRVVFSQKVREEVSAEKLLEVFKKCRFFALASYTMIKDRQAITIGSTDSFPIFMWETATFKKIYQPWGEKDRRFLYYGDKPKDYYHQYEEVIKEHARESAKQEENYEEMDEKQQEKARNFKFDEVLLASGGSDGMNLMALGYKVIWGNSETATLPWNVWEGLNRIAHRVVNVPDIDVTGKRRAHELAQNFIDLYTAILPDSLNERGGKDVRDFLKYNRPRKLYKIIENANCYRFWDMRVDYNKSGKLMSIGYDVNNVHLYFFLAQHGFFQLRKKNMEDLLVQTQGNTVEEITIKDVKKFVNKYLADGNYDKKLRNTFYRTTQLNAGSIENIEFRTVDFKDFEKDRQFIFYQNKIAEVSGEGISLHEPGTVNRYVWDDEVIKHDLKECKPQIFTTINNDGQHIAAPTADAGIFTRFVFNTCRLHWRTEELGRAEIDASGKTIHRNVLTEEEATEQYAHFANRCYAIGYLLHRYKDPSKPWAVWALENKPTADGESDGGSGKSITLGLPRYFMKSVSLNGRDQNFTENKHLLENVTEHTDFVLIDDPNEYINFAYFYPLITGDWPINPKNTRSFTIPFSEAPKMGFPSNFPPRNVDPSLERRLLYTVFSDYYHGANSEFEHGRTPRDDFKKNLFLDFDEEEWNETYHFAMECLRYYLSCEDKINPPMAGVTRRQLLSEMGEVFHAWCDAYFDMKSGNLNEFIVREEAFRDFKDNGKLSWTPQKFGKALRAWCKLKGYELNPKVHQNEGGRIIREHNGKTKEMIYISTNGTEGGLF
jgi:hypothetical protein